MVGRSLLPVPERGQVGGRAAILGNSVFSFPGCTWGVGRREGAWEVPCKQRPGPGASDGGRLGYWGSAGDRQKLGSSLLEHRP